MMRRVQLQCSLAVSLILKESPLQEATRLCASCPQVGTLGRLHHVTSSLGFALPGRAVSAPYFGNILELFFGNFLVIFLEKLWILYYSIVR